MKIPAFDLESRVLMVAFGAALVAVLRIAHLIHFSGSGDVDLLFFFAILLANFVVRSRYAAAGTALSFLCFESLCWINPPSGNSIIAAIFHGFLLTFFGLGFALYAFGAVHAWFRPRSKSKPVRRMLPMVRSASAPELSGVSVEGAQ